MRTLIIGVDSGTQSTKALVVNAKTGQVHGKGAAAYGLIPNLPTGAKEQHPQSWRSATSKAIKAALKQAKACLLYTSPREWICDACRLFSNR